MNWFCVVIVLVGFVYGFVGGGWLVFGSYVVYVVFVFVVGMGLFVVGVFGGGDVKFYVVVVVWFVLG